MKIKKSQINKINELVKLFNSSELAEVKFENGKLRGPRFALKYIKDKVKGSINESKDGFKPQVIQFPGEGNEGMQILVEKSGDTFFLTRLLDEGKNKRLRVLESRDLALIPNVKDIKPKDIKRVLDFMYSTGRNLGL